MFCRKCGTEIDANHRNPDGTIECPGCGTIYKVNQNPRSGQSNKTRQYNHKAHSPASASSQSHSRAVRPSSHRIGVKPGMPRWFIGVVIASIVALCISGITVITKKPTKQSSIQDSTLESMPTSVATTETVDTSLGSYDPNGGPVLLDGSIKGGFTLYQVNIENGAKQKIFEFYRSEYITTILDEPYFVPIYSWKLLFNSDMTKMAVCKYDNSNNSYHVGWVDQIGNFTDVTEYIHPSTNGFTSRIPMDVSALFSPDGSFFFCDEVDNKYYYVDIESKTIIREEEPLLDQYDKPVYDVFLLPDSNPNVNVTKNSGPDYVGLRYIGIDLIVSSHKLFGGYFKAYDITETGTGYGIHRNETIGYYIGKYGLGITEVKYDNEYYDEETVIITPKTDYAIESCAYHNGRIAFIANRGIDRGLYIINDSENATPREIIKLNTDDSTRLLFWK